MSSHQPTECEAATSRHPSPKQS